MPDIQPQLPDQPFDLNKQSHILKYAFKCASANYQPTNEQLESIGITGQNINKFNNYYQYYFTKTGEQRNSMKRALEIQEQHSNSVINLSGGKRKTKSKTRHRKYRKHKIQRKTKKIRKTRKI